MSDRSRPSHVVSRRALVGSAAAVAAGLLGRPSYAQQSILWYSASASGDEEWAKMFKAKTGVGVSICGRGLLTERIEQEAREAVRFSVMDISIPV